MDTRKIQEALREAEIYIGDRSAGSAPFWDALSGARAQMQAIEKALDRAALQKLDERSALRDTCAAAALTGILANPTTQAAQMDWETFAKTTAMVTYAIADAMLSAREGK